MFCFCRIDKTSWLYVYMIDINIDSVVGIKMKEAQFIHHWWETGLFYRFLEETVYQSHILCKHINHIFRERISFLKFSVLVSIFLGKIHLKFNLYQFDFLGINMIYNYLSVKKWCILECTTRSRVIQTKLETYVVNTKNISQIYSLFKNAEFS